MAVKQKKKNVSKKDNTKTTEKNNVKDVVVKEEKTVKKVNETKDDKKKELKKETKKVKSPVKKESSIKRWFKEVISEFKKVRWPNKKEMIKYSIATIVFILFFALFFYVIEVAIYLINQVI